MNARQDRRADFRDLRLLIDKLDEGPIRTPEERTELARRALRLVREAAWHAARAARILSLLGGSHTVSSDEATDFESPPPDGGEGVAQ